MAGRKGVIERIRTTAVQCACAAGRATAGCPQSPTEAKLGSRHQPTGSLSVVTAALATE